MKWATRVEVRTKLIALGIIVFALLVSWIWRSAMHYNHTVNENAVIITGECIVINYDATPEQFDEAKAKWLEVRKEHPPKGTGHTKAYY